MSTPPEQCMRPSAPDQWEFAVVGVPVATPESPTKLSTVADNSPLPVVMEAPTCNYAVGLRAERHPYLW